MNFIFTSLKLSLLIIFVFTIAINCYTKIKMDEYRQNNIIEQDSLIQSPNEQVKEIKFKYPPDSNSDIQVKYYLHDERGVQFINQINFSGYLERYFLEKDLSIINVEFQIDANLYSILLDYFNKSGFLDYPQILPQTNQLRWPGHGVTIFYRSSSENEFKGVNIDLTADKKYYPEGFYNLFYKLLETSKDPRYQPN